jgi:hypothetical protein
VVVKPGEPLEIEPPADLRITNVALSDELEDPQGRSSLKLIYRSPSADDDDEDEDDEDAEDSEEVVDTVLCSLTPGKVCFRLTPSPSRAIAHFNFQIEQTTLDLVFEGGVGFALEVTGKKYVSLATLFHPSLSHNVSAPSTSLATTSVLVLSFGRHPVYSSFVTYRPGWVRPASVRSRRRRG